MLQDVLQDIPALEWSWFHLPLARRMQNMEWMALEWVKYRKYEADAVLASCIRGMLAFEKVIAEMEELIK